MSVSAIALSARVDVTLPATPVPQSLQTFAVLVVGGLLGFRVGVGALLAYLCAGALGLPVFAGGAAGIAVLVGPTAGYLVGFVAAAGFVGWMRDRGHLKRLGTAVATMVVAHVVILLMGWVRLGLDVGAGAAWEGGVAPFVTGGVFKSLAAAIVILAVGSRAPAPKATA